MEKPAAVLTRVIGWDRSRLAIVLKLTTIGNSTGVVLPKEMLLRVDQGDTLYVVETPAASR